METLSKTEPLLEIAIGILMLVVAILVHGVGLRMINRRFTRAWSQVTARTPHWRINLTLASVVGSLATLHMVAPLVFATPLYLGGVFPALRDSYYYVLESYTTLGEGTLHLPDKWRLFGPMMAMSGLFTFGWTGSVLVSIMTRFAHLDAQQAHDKLEAPEREP